MGGRSIAIALNYPVEIHGNLKGSATTWTTTSVFCKLLKFYVRDEVGEGEGGDDETADGDHGSVVSRAVRVGFTPVLRSGLGLPGCWVAHGGVVGCWVVSRLQVNALCCAACRTGRASTEQRRCKALFRLGLNLTAQPPY
jgi:hypothetical protein